MVRSLLLFAALLFIALAPTKAVTLKATPEQSFAPAHIILSIRITRSPENRTLGWACDSGDFYRSSVMTLDGANSPAQFIEDKALRQVPEGEYDCAAQVTHADGSTDKAMARFTVIGQ